MYQVKKICWKTLHELLQLKSILVNRHNGTNGQCPICLQGPEDIFHLHFSCGRAVEMWRLLGTSNIIADACHGQIRVCHPGIFIQTARLLFTTYIRYWSQRRNSHCLLVSLVASATTDARQTSSTHGKECYCSTGYMR